MKHMPIPSWKYLSLLHTDLFIAMCVVPTRIQTCPPQKKNKTKTNKQLERKSKSFSFHSQKLVGLGLKIDT